MNKKDPDFLKDVEMLEQPLLTEDGFINEACMNELSTAIANMPKNHDRLAGDSEWSTPKWTHWRDVVGAFAQTCIRNIADYYRDDDLEEVYPDGVPIYPPELEKVLGYLGTCLRKEFTNREGILQKDGFANVSLCDISRMLYDILYDQGVTDFDAWNTEEGMGKHWLDLDALMQQTCCQIKVERRENDRFVQLPLPQGEGIALL